MTKNYDEVFHYCETFFNICRQICRSLQTFITVAIEHVKFWKNVFKTILKPIKEVFYTLNDLRMSYLYEFSPL